MNRFTPCECQNPGWCERHQCLKPSALFHLCRRNRLWFEAWETGTRPCAGEPEPNETQAQAGPNLVQRALNLGRAVVRHAANGFAQVDDATYESRLEICRACSSCDLTRMVCREQTCGCYLQTKAKWASEGCVLAKWLPVPTGSETTVG
jgi:hypothetical protein